MANLYSIDEVIAALDAIIAEAEIENDTSGYFAAIYRKVTIRVKDGIANNEFENGYRMEKLDVIFASRYINAHHAWKQNKPVTSSWQKAFEISGNYWPIVFQHLLMGMNAHINLDLGIAAAEVTGPGNIHHLKNDFDKINGILASLVNEVQDGLTRIWPRLKWVLQKTKRVDGFFIDFSMQLSRDGAWKYALTMAGKPAGDLPALIEARDKIIAEKTKLVTNPGFVPMLVFGIIRLGEKGTLKEKIACLK